MQSVLIVYYSRTGVTAKVATTMAQAWWQSRPDPSFTTLEKPMQALDRTHRQFILNLLAATHDMTLATVRPDGFPQATVISFVNDGLTLYAGIGLDSQKAHNIRQNDKVSATITPPYSDWRHIRGLSLAGHAAIVAGAEETAHAADLMLFRFPQLRQLMPANGPTWPGAVFMRIVPSIISVLDYELGFGHTALFEVLPDI